LIKKLNEKLGTKDIKCYSGISYRNLTIIKNGPLKAKCTPPHDITNQKIYDYLPEESSQQLLNELMFKSRKILAKENSAATQIWLWGQGKAPKLEPITAKYNIKGTVITAVDLLKGIGIYAGLDAPAVKGATGFIDTNYHAKVAAGLDALEKQELLIMHIEAPDECGHMGDTKLKIQAIENFDNKVVGTIINKLREKKEDFRVLVLPDHPTPIEIQTHSSEPVPFVYYDSAKEISSDIKEYNETTAQASGLKIKKGSQLLEKLINADF